MFLNLVFNQNNFAKLFWLKTKKLKTKFENQNSYQKLISNSKIKIL